MAENSKIEWTDATWNPTRARRHSHPGGPVTHVGWHCEKVSAGCENCYAQGINLRLGTKLPFKPGHLAPRGDVEVFLDEKLLLAPLRWKKPRMIFVNSMTDSFGRFVTDEMLDRIFAVMALCPQHTFQVLTKRPERMREYLARPDISVRVGLDALGMVLDAVARDRRSTLGAGVTLKSTDINPGGLTIWPLPNVWLGTSAEDQTTADARIPELLATPAAIRFISAEPLLGQVTIEEWLHDSHCWEFPGTCICSEPREVSLDWVIVGGESGPGARPMHPDWARGLRDQCVAAGVPFFFKQWGEWAPGASRQKRDSWVAGQLYEAVSVFGDPAWVAAQNAPWSYLMERLGKKAAGRLLDGRTWDQMPGVAHG